MSDFEACGINGCPALAIDAEGFCSVHKIAKAVPAHLADQPCRKCHRPIARGELIPRACTGESLEHQSCPPTRKYAGLKMHREKPLLAGTEPLDGVR